MLRLGFPPGCKHQHTLVAEQRGNTFDSTFLHTVIYWLTLDMANVTEGAWDSLPVKLNENILQTLKELKFTHMTPVQVTNQNTPIY